MSELSFDSNEAKNRYGIGFVKLVINYAVVILVSYH